MTLKNNKAELSIVMWVFAGYGVRLDVESFDRGGHEVIPYHHGGHPLSPSTLQHGGPPAGVIVVPGLQQQPQLSPIVDSNGSASIAMDLTNEFWLQSNPIVGDFTEPYHHHHHHPGVKEPVLPPQPYHNNNFDLDLFRGQSQANCDYDTALVAVEGHQHHHCVDGLIDYTNSELLHLEHHHHHHHLHHGYNLELQHHHGFNYDEGGGGLNGQQRLQTEFRQQQNLAGTEANFP
jgi:hypothetical protein